MKMKSFLLNECWVYQNFRPFGCGLAVIQKKNTNIKQKLEYLAIFSVNDELSRIRYKKIVMSLISQEQFYLINQICGFFY